jgi:hypothetical protein
LSKKLRQLVQTQEITAFSLIINTPVFGRCFVYCNLGTELGGGFAAPFFGDIIALAFAPDHGNNEDWDFGDLVHFPS